MDEIVGAAMVNVKYLFHAPFIFNMYGIEPAFMRW